MNDPYELKAAVLAAKENTSLPVVATMIFDTKGRLLTGGGIPAAVAPSGGAAGGRARGQLRYGAGTDEGAAF